MTIVGAKRTAKAAADSFLSPVVDFDTKLITSPKILSLFIFSNTFTRCQGIQKQK